MEPDDVGQPENADDAQGWYRYLCNSLLQNPDNLEPVEAQYFSSPLDHSWQLLIEVVAMNYFAAEPNQNPNNIAKDVFKKIVSTIKDLQALVQSQQLFQMFEDSGRSEK
jgi:hypothetical protein